MQLSVSNNKIVYSSSQLITPYNNVTFINGPVRPYPFVYSLSNSQTTTEYIYKHHWTFNNPWKIYIRGAVTKDITSDIQYYAVVNDNRTNINISYKPYTVIVPANPNSSVDYIDFFIYLWGSYDCRHIVLYCKPYNSANQQVYASCTYNFTVTGIKI